jgi:diacylglycerol O-acyltransferase
MQQLSALDAQFLNVESTTTLGHVGSLLVLDPANAPNGPLTLDRLRDVIEPRLHLAPALRQRLVTVPLGLGRPYWIDDPEFDLEFHLREFGLPDPGDDNQLAEQVARISARPLDRSRPLWEAYLIHHLEGGRQAIYTKIHHAAIDGMSGVEVLATLTDTSAEGGRLEEEPAEVWRPEPLPSSVELLRQGLMSLAAEPREIARTLPKALPHLGDIPGSALLPGAQAVSDIADSLVQLAGRPGRSERPRTLTPPKTRLNGPITGHRRFAFGSLGLDDVRRVKKTFGMTVNDVLLALCTSALRRWLLDHDGLPEDPLVVAVPVSVRDGDGESRGANSISIMVVEMPTHLADPKQRLVAVQSAIGEAKAHFDAVPATILQDVASVVPTAFAGLAFRAMFSMENVSALPFNLFVSNVPGPQQPLYVGGAQVLGVYPASGISNLTGALNITVFSYDGSLDFGLMACRELVPDVWNLIGYLGDALAELQALVETSPS